MPDYEAQNDFSPFSDILDDVQSEEEDDQNQEQKKEEKEDEDEQMVISSEDEEMEEEKDEEKEQNDDPMDVEEEEQPEAKRRKIANMIRSINSTAVESNVCLACGSADHSIDQCSNLEARREISDALQTLLSRFKEPSSSPKVRKESQKGEPKRKAPVESTPERVTVSYPSELSMLDIDVLIFKEDFLVQNQNSSDLQATMRWLTT